MNLSSLCSSVRELAVETGHFIQQQQKKLSTDTIQSKGLHNFVTDVDTRAEERLVSVLKELLPEAGFIAEEGTGSKVTGQYNWIVDPLDGTTNFIHGLPPYAVSVALNEDGETLLGVVYEICLDECFYAWKGSPAYLNGNPVRTSTTERVSQSLIATGFPYTNFEHIDAYMQSFRYFLRHSHGLRRLGSAATDIAYIACGRFEAFYEYGLHAWDVAAAALILKQAGGRVADFSGGDNWMFGGRIIATNPHIYEEFLDIIHRIMVEEKTLI
jgi:myo-inositol-1(or 4)-monophosphatase